jgi:hypothetical protein
MDTLNKGTAEIISVQLDDLLGEITTLDGINCEQRIISEDEKTQMQAWTTVADTEDMRVDCLIATDNTWDEGTYKLFVRLNIPPETPIKGPFLFGVS